MINIFQLKATVTHCCEALRKLFSEWGVPIPNPSSQRLGQGIDTCADNGSTVRDFFGGHQLLAEVIGELTI